MRVFGQMLFSDAKARFPELAYRIQLSEDAEVFVKASDRDVYTSEALGLETLRNTETIRVPKVIATGRADQFMIVLELIRTTSPSNHFFEEFGRQLAQMHLSGTSDRFGFPTDNYLGLSPQPNPLTEDWVDFFRTHRLSYQLDLADKNDLGGNELQRLGRTLLDQLDSLLGFADEPPALIHGDLWSGNWLCDNEGQLVLIDPAPYYAHREAEFGMTTLFGGLPRGFYDAYNEVWPMESGWEDRVAVYRLYHLLNHLNLFGNTYKSDCVRLLRELV